jgi:hypothetical protein
MVAAAARPLLSPDDSTAVVVEVGFRYGERWSVVWKGGGGARRRPWKIQRLSHPPRSLITRLSVFLKIH